MFYMETWMGSREWAEIYRRMYKRLTGNEPPYNERYQGKREA